MGSKQSLQASAPFFLPQGMLGSSHLPIFFAPLHLGACLQTTLIPSIPYCSLLALLVIGIDLTY